MRWPWSRKPVPPREWFGGTCWVVSAQSTDQRSLLRAAHALRALAPSAVVVVRPDVVIVAIRADLPAPPASEANLQAARQREVFDPLLRCLGALLHGGGIVSIGVARGHCEELPTPVLQPGIEGRGVIRASRARNAAEDLPRTHPDLATSHRVVVGADGERADATDDVDELVAAIRHRAGRPITRSEVTDPKQIDGQDLTSYVLPLDDVLAAARATPLVFAAEHAVGARATDVAESKEPHLAFAVHADLIGSTAKLGREPALPWYVARFHRVLRKHLPALLEIADPAPAASAPLLDLQSRMYFVTTGDGFHLCLYLDGHGDADPPAALKKGLLDWLATLIAEVEGRGLKMRIAAALGPQASLVAGPSGASDPWSTRTPEVSRGYPRSPHAWVDACLKGIERNRDLRDVEVRCAGPGLEDELRAAVQRGNERAPAGTPPPRLREMALDETTGVVFVPATGRPGRRFGQYVERGYRDWLADGLDADPERDRGPAAAGFVDRIAAGRADDVLREHGPPVAKDTVAWASEQGKRRAVAEALLTATVGALLSATASAGGHGDALDLRRGVVAAVGVIAALALARWYTAKFVDRFTRIAWIHVGPTMRRYSFARGLREPIQRLKIALLLDENHRATATRLFGRWGGWFAPRPERGVGPDARAELRVSRLALVGVGALGALVYLSFAFGAALLSGMGQREGIWLTVFGGGAGVAWNLCMELRLSALSFEQFSLYLRARSTAGARLRATLADLLELTTQAAHLGLAGWCAAEARQPWAYAGAAVVVLVSLGGVWYRRRATVAANLSIPASAEPQLYPGAVIDPRKATLRDQQAQARTLQRAAELVWRQRRDFGNRFGADSAVFVVDQYGEILWQSGLVGRTTMARLLADGSFASKIIGDFVRYSRVPPPAPGEPPRSDGWMRFNVRCDDELLRRQPEVAAGKIRVATAQLETHALGFDRDLPAGYLAILTRTGEPTELHNRRLRHTSRDTRDT